MILQELQPKNLWYYFEEISKIPRCSKHEELIREFVIQTAKRKKLRYKVDQTGNVVIKKGNPNEKTTVLQAHLDMVCEKNNDVLHDFSKDPLNIYIDGDWVKAKGTTLGADNGIGVAAALAMLEEDIEPIEVLLTIDEETGLTGASNISPDFIKGRILLNLDTEKEGVFIIGCAGGRDSIIRIKIDKKRREEKGFEITIKRLKGGHSGMDINTGRANAIKLMADILSPLINDIEIAEFEGGDKRNAIPRECKVLLYTKVHEPFKEVLISQWNRLKEKYRKVEKVMNIEIEEKEIKEVMISGNKLIKLLKELPHGVISMDEEIPNVVRTSTNLASIHSKDQYIEIVESSRSSDEVELEKLMNKIKIISENVGAEIEQNKGYPSWRTESNSFIVTKSWEVYENLFNKPPEVTIIHAGLETGIIGKRIKDMDMISFGPTIKNPHSPDERVLIPSVKTFYNFLLALVKELQKR